jgi:hypothetical protein
MAIATQTNNITLSFIGKLVSTTDNKWARRLNRRVSVRALLGNRAPMAHFEHVDNGILVYAFGEMYELEP